MNNSTQSHGPQRAHLHMKKFLVRLLARLFVFALALPLHIHAQCAITVIPTGATNVRSPQIDGNTVVWSGQVGGVIHIFKHNGTSVTQLSTTSINNSAPQIDGNTVVWSGVTGGVGHIFKHDGTSITQLSTTSTFNGGPQIDGNTVVWRGRIGGVDHIFKHDGTSVTQLSTTSTENEYPQIDGNTVVWIGRIGGVGHIFKHDGTSVTQLSTTTTENAFPEISGNTVVWRGRIGGVDHIFKHDGTSITQLSTTPANFAFPQIDGNVVVWYGFVGGLTHVFKHDGTSVTQLSTTSTNNDNPQIDGNTVVWRGIIGGVAHIFKHDGTSVTQISTTSTNNREPQIQGNTIVWYGTEAGVENIYRALVATATQDMTWTGAVSTDWNNPCNWSPNGVPMATNQVVINDVANDPVILSGTTAVAKEIYINANASLTVSSGGTLNVNNTTAAITLQGGNIINDGTINLNGSGYGIGIVIGATASITNRGTISTNNAFGASLAFGNLTFTNESTGIFNGDFKANNNILTLTNRGTINYSGGTFALSLGSSGSNVLNTGTISITAGSGISNPSGSTITNNACGKILMTTGGYENGGTTTNAGLIQTSNNLNNTGGTFTNNGVLKYNSLLGNAIINNQNSSVIVKNTPTPIFTYGGLFDGMGAPTINGIFTNATATTSAGTFTAPNTFVPSGLACGSQTLYAKITPSGGACTYVVSFTYDNVPPTITTKTPTAICAGSRSFTIPYTATKGTPTTYSISGTGITAVTDATLPTGAITVNLSAAASGTAIPFTLTVKNASGCTSANITGSVAVNVNTPPSVSISPTAICAGTSTTLTATAVNGGSGPQFTWTKNNVPVGTVNTLPVSNAVAGDVYKVTLVPSAAVCPSPATAMVSVTVSALPSLTLGTIPAICVGVTSFTIPYTAAKGSPTTYSISGTGITTVTDAALPSSPITVNLSAVASGTSIPFTLTVKGANGCSSANIIGSVTVNNCLPRFPYVVCPDAKILNFEDLVNGIVPTTTATTNNGIATSITSTDKIFELSCGSTTRPEGFPFDAFFNPMSATGVGSVVVRTFTAYFGGGTSSTCSQVFYIKLLDPNTTQAPAATTALCQNGVPNTNPNSTGYPRFSNGNVILDFIQDLMATYTDAPITGGSLVRTWTVKNKCGASKTFTQNITIPTCVAPQIAISGEIKRETGENIVATVKIFNTRDSINKAEGSFYSFPSVPVGESYRMKPERTYDVLNGVSTFDINVIAKYLLGIETAKSPYQLIAMDVNRNGEIEAGDMLLIRNLILRKTDNFPNNTAWRFIPKSYEFKNPANPFAEDFPEILSLNNPTQNVTDADFVAVKVGDGNLSARTSNLVSAQVRNTPEIDYLQLPDMLLEQGKTYQIPVKINAKALVALQFALNIDKNNVESFSIENGDLAQFSEGNYNILDKNTVTTAWASSKAMSDNTIFTLVVKAKKQVSIKDVVSLNTSFSDNLGYNTEGGEKHLQLSFTGEKVEKLVFDLHQNRPNPFNSETIISFILPETNTAELSIFDITGRKVYTLNRAFSKGYNEVILDKSVLRNTGVYFYQLQSDKYSAVKRMFYLN